MLTSDDLVLVLAISQEGSVTGAAERLRTSQPALSRSLASLERRLGLKLFDRQPRGMLTTAAGAALVEHGRAVEAVTARAQRELDARKDGDTVEVLVGCVPQISVIPVARALTAMQRVEANVRVYAKVGSGEDLLQELRDGELDLVIGTMPFDVDLTATPLFEVRPALVVRSGHPLLEETVDVAALAGYGWIMPPDSDPLTERIKAMFQDAGAEPPTPAVVTVDVPLATAMVMESDLIAVLPRDVATIALASGRVKTLPLELPGPHGVVATVQRRDMPARPEVERLVDALHAELERVGIKTAVA